MAGGGGGTYIQKKPLYYMIWGKVETKRGNYFVKVIIYHLPNYQNKENMYLSLLLLCNFCLGYSVT